MLHVFPEQKSQRHEVCSSLVFYRLKPWAIDKALICFFSPEVVLLDMNIVSTLSFYIACHSAYMLVACVYCSFGLLPGILIKNCTEPQHCHSSPCLYFYLFSCLHECTCTPTPPHPHTHTSIHVHMQCQSYNLNFNVNSVQGWVWECYFLLYPCVR